MTKEIFTAHLLSLGYRDYIAARFLLQNEFIMQGITLASSSIEKYLKAILAMQGKGKKEMGVHMDKLDKIRALLKATYTDVTEKIDERFLEILGKAYSIRYYDDLKGPVSFGFFVNQFIGELDFSVHLIDSLFTFNEQNKSAYQLAAHQRNEHLLHNNYIFQGITKKEHMEMPDNGFGVYIDASFPHGEVHATAKGIRNEYDGRIYIVNVKPGN
jgi:hypothetical protein